jgi:hypothetical protein
MCGLQPRGSMQLETKFLRLRSRFGDWEVTWLGGRTRGRLSFLVMVVKIKRRSASARGKPQFRDGCGGPQERARKRSTPRAPLTKRPRVRNLFAEPNESLHELRSVACSKLLLVRQECGG